MRLLDLPDILRGAGLKVHEMDGWQKYGTQLRSVRGVVAHHTATGPKVKDDAVERLLRNGRPDLPGPLCQLGLRRDGTWVVVASGKANHNGYGVWGNDSIGVEAYNDGVGEPWPQVQYDSYVAGCRALSYHFKVPVRGHKETDPGRKIDPTFDMDKFRARIAAPPAPPEDDDMTPAIIHDPQGNRLVFIRGTDSHLHVKHGNEVWVDLGGKLTSGPDASTANGQVEVVGRGQDGATWLYSAPVGDVAAGKWVSLGGRS